MLHRPAANGGIFLGEWENGNIEKLSRTRTTPCYFVASDKQLQRRFGEWLIKYIYFLLALKQNLNYKLSVTIPLH